MRIVNQPRVRLRQAQRRREPPAVVAPRDLPAAPPPPLAQHMARPRGDVLRRQAEAVPREHRVGRLEPLELDGDGASDGVVRERDAPVGGRRRVVVGDGVEGHWWWGGEGGFIWGETWSVSWACWLMLQYG